MTLLNQAAEGLTGWSQPDALGKSRFKMSWSWWMRAAHAGESRPVSAAADQARDQGTRPFLLLSRHGVEHVIHESATGDPR